MVILQMPLTIGFVEIDLLQLGRRGKHDVRQARGIGHELLVNHGEEVVAVHPLCNETGIGRSAHRVGCEDVETHHRRIADLPGERRAKAIHVHPARLGWALRAMAQCLASPGDIVRRGVVKPTTSHAELPDDRRERGERAARLTTIAMPLDAVGKLQQGRFCRAIPASQSNDLRRRNTGDRGDSLRWVLLHSLAEILPADAVLAQPRLIMKSFSEEDVHESERQRAVGRRARPQMLVGRSRGRRAPGIDDDDVGAVALCVTHEGHEVWRRAGRIVSPDDDEPTVANIASVRGKATAERHLDRGFGCGPADRTLQSADAHPVPETDTGDSALQQPERAAEGIRKDRRRAVLGDDVLPSLGDLADGLIPGDAGPLAAPLRSDTAQRVVQPVGE